MLGCLLWSAVGAVSLYLVIAFIGVGAQTAAAVPIWLGLAKQVTSAEVVSFTTPGSVDANLQAGPHIIVSSPRAFGTGLSIISASTGEQILIQRVTNSVKYELDYLWGDLIYSFEVPEDDLYRISWPTSDEVSRLQIAPSYGRQNVIVIIIFYSVLGAAFIFIVWLWRRPKRMAEAAEKSFTTREKAAKWDALINSQEDGQNS